MTPITLNRHVLRPMPFIKIARSIDYDPPHQRELLSRIEKEKLIAQRTKVQEKLQAMNGKLISEKPLIWMAQESVVKLLKFVKQAIS